MWMIHLDFSYILEKYRNLGMSLDDKIWEDWVQQNGGTIVFGLRIGNSAVGEEGGATTTNIHQLMWGDGDGDTFKDDENDWIHNNEEEIDEEDNCNNRGGDEVEDNDDADNDNI
ncbi:hypothetical protein ACA910_022369 [Epithemia clementina (nom. ined.)]